MGSDDTDDEGNDDTRFTRAGGAMRSLPLPIPVYAATPIAASDTDEESGHEPVQQQTQRERVRSRVEALLKHVQDLTFMVCTPDIR